MRCHWRHWLRWKSLASRLLWPHELLQRVDTTFSVSVASRPLENVRIYFDQLPARLDPDFLPDIANNTEDATTETTSSAGDSVRRRRSFAALSGIHNDEGDHLGGPLCIAGPGALRGGGQQEAPGCAVKTACSHAWGLCVVLSQ